MQRNHTAYIAAKQQLPDLAEWDAALAAHGCKPKREGKGIRGQCPGPHHRNGNRSRALHVEPGHTAAVVATCHGGCSFSEIVDALGIRPPPRRRLTPEQRRDLSSRGGTARAIQLRKRNLARDKRIRAMRRDGMSYRAIGRAVGRSHTQIRRICARRWEAVAGRPNPLNPDAPTPRLFHVFRAEPVPSSFRQRSIQRRKIRSRREDARARDCRPCEPAPPPSEMGALMAAWEAADWYPLPERRAVQ